MLKLNLFHRRRLMLTFLLSVAVAVAVADDNGSCKMSGYMRGVIDDIHLLVREDMCTIVEVQDMQTMMSNHKTEIKTILNNQNTEIQTIKNQMSKIISMLEKPGVLSIATPVTATTPETTTPLTTTTTPACSVRAAGLEDSAIIEDHQLTSSSHFGGYYAPRFGRLHSTTGRGWLMSPPYRVGEWLQVDLESNRRIFGVATQGDPGYSNYATTYVITYKRDGQQSFQTYTDDKGNAKTFNGNVDNDSVVKNNFEVPFTARYIRILPQKWQNHPSLRWELYVC